jgi:hypothetical protein
VLKDLDARGGLLALCAVCRLRLAAVERPCHPVAG